MHAAVSTQQSNLCKLAPNKVLLPFFSSNEMRKVPTGLHTVNIIKPQFHSQGSPPLVASALSKESYNHIECRYRGQVQTLGSVVEILFITQYTFSPSSVSNNATPSLSTTKSYIFYPPFYQKWSRHLDYCLGLMEMVLRRKHTASICPCLPYLRFLLFSAWTMDLMSGNTASTRMTRTSRTISSKR